MGIQKSNSRRGIYAFELFGTKLKGGWHLVRSGKPARQPQWLLFKERDEYAGTLEADDMLADVSEASAEDLKRSGAGKADKKKLTAVPVKKARKKAWLKKALVLTDAKSAKAPAKPFEPQLAKLGESPPQGE